MSDNPHHPEPGKGLPEILGFFDVLEDAVVGVDGTRRVTAWNASAERLFGAKREEVLGSQVDAAVPDGALPREPAGAHRPYRLEFDLPDRKPAGRRRVEGWVFAGPGFVGPDTALLGVYRPTTHEGAPEELSRSSPKAEVVGSLASRMAHDFNNLLNVIGGYTQLVYLTTDREDPSREKLGEVLRATQQATNLTRQLLTFGRQQTSRPQALDINEAVLGMQGLLRRLVGENVNVVTKLSLDPGWIRIDPGQFEQVVLNLAVNARDAMPDGGRLTLSSSTVVLGPRRTNLDVPIRPGRYVLLTVNDEGTGIPPEAQPHVFEPFFTTKERKMGAGLGLSSVYGIVKQNDGYIFVESAVGTGTAVKIYLPLVEGGPESHPTGNRASTPAEGRHGTILLVEDEPAVRGLAEEVLIEAGYRVVAASTPEQALEIADIYPEVIDLLLSDVVMPRMSGPDVANVLLRRRPEMKVLFMSGYTEDALVNQEALGDDAILLQKPFTSKELVEKIRQALAP